VLYRFRRQSTTAPCPFPDCSKTFQIRKFHNTNFRGIYLRVTTDCSKQSVEKGGVEQGRNSKNVILRKFAIRVINVIDVVLKGQPSMWHLGLKQTAGR